MVKINVIPKYSEDELDLMDSVVSDFFERGETDLHCSRCGNDFEFHKTQSSYSIKCKTEDCLKLTCRGI